MLDKVASAISRYNMFSSNDRVGVAISGGADSVCLLMCLLHLRQTYNLQLHAIHLNHQLRGPASLEDAAFVEALARNHDLPFHLETVDVAAWAAGAHDNLEQAARGARQRFFQRLRSEGFLDKIATGHTLSDQAETVLFRFLRGSGPTGLAGILPVTKEGIVRPLIGVTRAEVEDFLRDAAIPYRTDETNHQTTFARNRIRMELLPSLASHYNPAIIAQLAQTAELAREEEAYWAAQIEGLAEEICTSKPPSIIVNCPKLAPLPTAAARRLLRWAFARVKGDLRQIEFQHVEHILTLSQGADGHGRAILPGLDVMRSFEWLRVAPVGLDAGVSRVLQIPLPLPGSASLSPSVCIRTVILPGAAPNYSYNEEQIRDSCNFLDLDKVMEPLTLRYWLPGDAYPTQGSPQQNEKLKQMFQTARIPLWERRFWPIIEDSRRIVWSRRFGPNPSVAPDAATRRLLRIEEIGESVVTRESSNPGNTSV